MYLYLFVRTAHKTTINRIQSRPHHHPMENRHTFSTAVTGPPESPTLVGPLLLFGASERLPDVPGRPALAVRSAPMPEARMSSCCRTRRERLSGVGERGHDERRRSE